MVAVLLRADERVKQLLALQGSDPRIEVAYEGVTHTALSLAVHQPKYSWSKEACDDTTEYLARSLTWSPDNHRLFPPAFRRGNLPIGHRSNLN